METKNRMSFRAGLVQLRTGRSIAANIEAAEAGIRSAARDGAHYVQTPECTNIMELDRKRLLEMLSEADDSRVLRYFCDLARELEIWLHLGSLVVRTPSGKTANRAHVIDPSGVLKATYDKIHMFDVDLPGGESYRESRAYEAGTEAVLTPLPWGSLGLTVCYDLRFPALYRGLAQAGADFLAIPSAFTRQTGEAHWSVLQRARAIETGCFVFSAAQGGRHENGRETWGHSMIVDPWGDVLGEADDTPGVLVADIDVGRVNAARRRIPSLTHDRAFELAAAGPVSRVVQFRDAS